EVGAWTYHYSDQGDYTWEQARNYCQTFFTDLVAIQNKQEIEYLNKSLPFHRHYYWIGIRKLGGTWTWVGTRKALTKEAENWAAGEPNNRRSNQDCVEIYIKRQKESGKWNDESCNRRKKALCYQASCQPFPCSQHGECVETIGSYRCECYPGFHGLECEDVVQCAKLKPKGVHMNCSHPYGDFSYNSTCMFECQEGFERRGAGMLQCLASQQWSAETPTCTGRACQGLGGLRDVAWMLCGVSPACLMLIRQEMGWSCRAPVLWGSSFCHCEGRGCPALMHPAPSLPSAIACPQLVATKRGWVNCSHPHGTFTFIYTSAFSLQRGFEPTGVWRLQGTAIRVRMTSLPRAVKVEVPQHRASETLVGNSRYSIRCGASCLFNAIYPVSEICSPIAAITCPVLSAPDRGKLNCSHLHGDFAFGSTCAFSCQTGFALMGSESRECTASGTWTGNAPHCEATTCPVLSAPDWGELNCSHLHGDFAFGSKCAFSCQKGFALMGSESRECTASGTWTGEAPRCEGRAAAQGTGFALMGSESRECTASGTWTGDAPHCEGRATARAQVAVGFEVILGFIKCSALAAPKMGKAACSHLHGDFAFGSTCIFSCQTGFVLIGPKSCKCMATGTWTGDTPQCRATSCPVLDPPSRGQLSCSHVYGNFTYNSTCTFSCEEGFVRLGAEVLRCMATGNWTRHPPACAG
ncbi:LYAM3 protein, partial [Rostratula benghalensis]|nr:LYAM3 protein [Rostratula benghalensis]